jgi:hypothetical protein
MRTTKSETEMHIEAPTTIDTVQLEGVTGGCAACGNAACQPGQAQQVPGPLQISGQLPQQVPTQLPL